MNYQETCEYLFSQMPMFERQGAAGYKEGLANTLALDKHFGHPHQAYATIHVAGTNGKGSVSHSLAAILQECGYRVGLYTSPHLVDFRERIRVNGRPVSREYVVSFVERERRFFEPLHPSFFEVTTAMAFQYFKERHVDIAVVEVGLGGRLDCTNIITPIVSIITNISFDHTQFLGDTLAKIASEKAGVIKPGTPVIIGEANEETRPVFEARAREQQSPIGFAEDDPMVISAEPLPGGGMRYHTRLFGTIDGDLGGIYQQKNLNTLMPVLKVLVDRGFLNGFTTDSALTQCQQELNSALGHVAEKTGLMGRWQTIGATPRVVCDTGHNVAGWQYLSRQLAQVACRQLHIVFGMVDDKDIGGVLELLPRQAVYYFTKAQTKRAVSETTVQSLAARHGLAGKAYPTVWEAYHAALRSAAREDMIFVGGSSYIVGDLLKTLG